MVRQYIAETVDLVESGGELVEIEEYAKLKAENELLSEALKNTIEVLESFRVSVNDNYYKDVMIILDSPYSYAIRIRNDSSESWIFKDLDTRRKNAATNARKALAESEEK